MNETPYIGFGNDLLAKLPPAKSGDSIECVKCGSEHKLQAPSDGKEILLFYKCKGKIYLGAVGGKLIVNVKPSCSGKT